MSRLVVLLVALGCCCASTRQFIVGGRPPGLPIMLTPACGATNVPLTQVLSFVSNYGETASYATSYAIQFGTVTPPVTLTPLTAPSYAPSLANGTTYYWIPVATNAVASVAGPVCSFTTIASGSSPFVATHPRLLLTPSVLAAAQARRTANTTAFQAVKAVADSIPLSAGIVSPLVGPLGLGGAGTTFTVADGTAFPTSGAVRIDLEVLTVTRSGNTFTVVGRGSLFYIGTTVAATHAAGAEVWNSLDNLSWNVVASSLALMTQLGDHSYDLRARAAVSASLTIFSEAALADADDLRVGGWNTILGYDWAWPLITPSERSKFGAAIRAIVENLITTPNGSVLQTVISTPGLYPRATQYQAKFIANVVEGELQFVMAAAAASDPENTSARTEWTSSYGWFTQYVVPGLQTGPFAEGVSFEGSEYGPETWVQNINLLLLIQSATGSNLFPSMAPYFQRQADFWFHITQPGSQNGPQSTATCAVTATVCTTPGSGFRVGQRVSVGFDAPYRPPGSNPLFADALGNWLTTIAASGGGTVTLADPMPAAATGTGLNTAASMFNFGDMQSSPNFADADFLNEAHEAANEWLSYFQSISSPYAGYVKFWIDQQFPALISYVGWNTLLFYDPTVSAVDYTGVLPTGFVTTLPLATGLLLDRSSWTDTATSVTFLPGGEVQDHVTMYFNEYDIKRKGVWLTSHLQGYGSTGLTPPLAWRSLSGGACAGSCDEVAYLGAHYHNVVSMNTHGSGTAYGVPDGPGVLSRGISTPTYAYARGDASLVYQAYNNNLFELSWADRGYLPAASANDARLFIRDFFYLKPDLVVFHDYLTYLTATLSPTEWHAMFTDVPSRIGQRITMTHGGQKLVQDVVLPAAATFTQTTLSTEAPELVGYRISTKSGATTAAETSVQVLQGMDAAGTPVAVTSLTTTSADVVQIGPTTVVGFVKTLTPAFPIVYTYGTLLSTHYLVGFAPSTPYHVSVNLGTRTVTITAATGVSDTPTTAQGLLSFTQ